MTIGDVLGFAGAIGGISLSLWVLLIGVALLFEAKASAAQRVLENEAGKAFGIGVAVLLPLGALAIVLLNLPNGLVKMLGFALFIALLAVSLLGGSGMALLMAERTGARDDRISPLTALARGAGMMSLAWIFPFLGWFFVAPVSVIAGLGAGAKVLWKRGAKAKKPTPLSPVQLDEPFAFDSQVAPQPMPQPVPSQLTASQTAPPLRVKDDESCESHGAIG